MACPVSWYEMLLFEVLFSVFLSYVLFWSMPIIASIVAGVLLVLYSQSFALIAGGVIWILLKYFSFIVSSLCFFGFEHRIKDFLFFWTPTSVVFRFVSRGARLFANDPSNSWEDTFTSSMLSNTWSAIFSSLDMGSFMPQTTPSGLSKWLNWTRFTQLPPKAT